MKRWIIGIRRHGESEVTRKGKDVPTGWLSSMSTMATVLSEDNRALLRIIQDAKSEALTQLVALSGRQVLNLSRTLRVMAGYGLVEL